MEIVHQQFGVLWVEKRNDGSVWFSAKDICDSLGYGNSREALSKHVPEKHTGVTKRDVRSENGVIQRREFAVIDESGLYRLILRSRMPNAEKFTDWVTEEVLPTIRKTGKFETKKLQNEQKQAKRELLKEMNKYLTYTDSLCVAKKLGVGFVKVANVMEGNTEDTTIMLEMFHRSTINRGVYEKFYTVAGIAETLELLRKK
jgi:prophage antirepressor-like protein